ncbi:alpha/beta fold hydrolase [Microlunatus speluncae]|uniref:alpha/beta fold hydrolase n=1 Tax=Microlunatus speluncae TaxID=2594267 RepID=UPI001266399F|nr:alpha/beta fold hydrolase [Microlunatus speluncae]
MTTKSTRTVDAPDAVLTFDVREPSTPGEHRPLFIFGSPMGASGFDQLVDQFDDRIVITYDPRGMERSTRDPAAELTVETHAEDYHRVVVAAGLGPVDAFGSSGGGMCGLHWIVAHPEDVRTFVSHEPPLIALVEDADAAQRVGADIVETYRRDGYGPAMAKFLRMVMHDGLMTDLLSAPAPDPAQFGLPTEDDGSRDDLLLSGNLAMPPFRPDFPSIKAGPVRLVAAIGAASGAGMACRGGRALAAGLGVEPMIFPGDHGGFAANEWAPGNDPVAFAAKLRDVIDRA